MARRACEPELSEKRAQKKEKSLSEFAEYKLATKMNHEDAKRGKVLRHYISLGTKEMVGGDTMGKKASYVAPNGSLWASEEAYLSFIGKQKENSTADVQTTQTDTQLPEETEEPKQAVREEPTKTEQTGNTQPFKAPNGMYWASEEAYQTYLKKLSGGLKIPGYIDEHGKPWRSKEAYMEYRQLISGGLPIPGYYDAKGRPWRSKEAYEEYLKALSGGMKTPGYIAPDGSPWQSEEHYLHYLQNLAGGLVIPGHMDEHGKPWQSKEQRQEYYAKLGQGLKNEEPVKEEKRNEPSLKTQSEPKMEDKQPFVENHDEHPKGTIVVAEQTVEHVGGNNMVLENGNGQPTQSLSTLVSQLQSLNEVAKARKKYIDSLEATRAELQAAINELTRQKTAIEEELGKFARPAATPSSAKSV